MWIIAVAYLLIGVLIGLSRVSKGIKGSKGPIATIFAFAILWPVVLIFEKNIGIR